MGGDFTYVSSSITPAGKNKSEPPSRKKPRTFRGKNSKSHEGDRPPNPNKITTDMTPGEYLQTIECVTLTEGDKLPSHVMNFQPDVANKVVRELEPLQVLWLSNHLVEHHGVV